MTHTRETKNQSLTDRIMRQVYFYWFMKRMAPAIVLQLGAFALLLTGIHEYVSIRFVAANATAAVSGGMGAMVSYVLSAVAKTGFIPQLLFGASVLLGILVLRDLRRALRYLLRREVKNFAALERFSS
ncbi:MAG: hypothetical protein HYT40_00510 [Candidatus Sungbacteria bacterium]|uniref:Uncharacterized protein n=1 Tax=Candidatus Sungiibacteriota bacterium TaxID=2750080 RepID=A0A931SAX7_9BACT|nr:hypothetical protein [Candidatus Sungbacteria bacterium]